jgi:uncharacterized protein
VRVALLALVVAAVACGRSSDASTAAFEIETDKGAVPISVEIADTTSERAEGLMGRGSLADDAGMVFLFPEPERGSFWMKDTLIPLSIAFWDERGRIVAMLDMDPCASDPCPTYDPGVEYAGAVEVNQGFFDRHGVEVGDRIFLADLQ